MRKRRGLVCGLASALSFLLVAPVASARTGNRRAFTVADSIEMRLVGSPRFGYLSQDPAQFSPDRTKFVIVVRKGNLKDNTNQYSLLLFNTAEAWSAPRPRVIASLASSSDDPAIDNVEWIDKERIGFLGSKPGMPTQIYVYELRTARLRQVSQWKTDIVRFEATADLSTIAFLAKPPIQKLASGEELRHGLVVSDQEISDLLGGHSSDKENGIIYPYQLLVQKQGMAARRIALPEENPRPECPFALSPDGKHLVVWVFIRNVPDEWKRYEAVAKASEYVFTYIVVDLSGGSVKRLLNAPLSEDGVYSHLFWTSDSKAIVVSGTYLPLSFQSEAKNVTGSDDEFVVEVSVPSGEVKRILKGNLQLFEFDRTRNAIFLRRRKFQDVIGFHKVGPTWERVPLETAAGRGLVVPFSVDEVEDMNTAPKLVMISNRTGEKRLLMDLNPQFASLKISPVEEITWIGTDGNKAIGGLYWPEEYASGQRYCLVIQTHGWRRDKFWVDGASTAGYAAQALAGRGCFVVQATDDVGKDDTTVREGPREAAMYEGLVDYLDQRGLIDRGRVGLMGWSRTGYHVRYALEFGSVKFAAAEIIDGMDGSYFQYLVDVHGPEAIAAYEHLQGAAPFGPGLQMWLKNATGFNLDKVSTPVRLIAFGPRSLLYNWEWFAGLTHLGKPVEFVWLRNAAHAPVKPWERNEAQQGTVDWFCFWLKGEKYKDRDKRDEFVRWEKLRRMKVAVQR
jgi:hypothetical protein